ncbi:MAG: 1-acyl-sn-glycerol-3-phosphate acyltransferase, partial [Firmicutes bacterium]|nr:1-acyl-sn-glycerol-3-phosphate acyltransferase [Bacillota bacterium]
MADKKKTIEKPDKFLYNLLIPIAKVLLKVKGNITYDKSGLADIKGPALVLCPHTSNIDFIFVAATLFPERPTFVVSEHFMAKPFIRWFLTKMNVISKKMFCPDIKTIMNIIRAKDSGNIIVLFPEGRLPAIGHSVAVTEGTADLIKKLGVNVYIITGNGAYKTLPKWGKAGIRKGKLEVTSCKLYDAADIKELSVDQINEDLDKAILHDEDHVLENVEYKCKKPALGLDGVLYKCPQCHAEFKMTSDDHHIMCECGFKAKLDTYYNLHGGPFGKINDWYFWQESEINIDEPMTSETILAVPGEDGNMNLDAGYGTITIDR